MGQLFHAVVYNIETRKCFLANVDKFHANCYSYSGAVCSTHYLLRKGPYHVMWCGGYVGIYDNIRYFLSKEKLLGISVCRDKEYFIDNFNNDDSSSKDLSEIPYNDKLDFIDENHDKWEKMDIWDKALNYFDYKNTHSVKYDGYLINHTKKLAIDLKNYYQKSLLLSQNNKEYLIDLIPCLTETGGGTVMALFEGCSEEVNENLIGSWCGDLLEIVDQCPQDYKITDCCFASIHERVRYCIKYFGTDIEYYVLKNKNGDKFECVNVTNYSLDLGASYHRSQPFYIKLEKENKKIYIKSVPKNKKRIKNEEEEKDKKKKKKKRRKEEKKKRRKEEKKKRK